MSVLIFTGSTLLALVLIFAAPLVGYVIQRRRRLANLAVRVPERRPAVRSVSAALARYERVMTAAHQRAAANIDAALREFVNRSGLDMPAVRAVPSSVEVALLRMRVGIREPWFAYRPAVAGTEEMDVAGLRRLLDLEDAAARIGYGTA